MLKDLLFAPLFHGRRFENFDFLRKEAKTDHSIAVLRSEGKNPSIKCTVQHLDNFRKIVMSKIEICILEDHLAHSVCIVQVEKNLPNIPANIAFTLAKFCIIRFFYIHITN